MKSTHRLKSTLWRYPSETAAWYFLSVDKNISDKIKKDFSHLRKGFGSLPVKVTIGKTVWKTSIFPQKDGPYLLPVKAKVRKEEGFGEGEEVTFTIDIIS